MNKNRNTIKYNKNTLNSVKYNKNTLWRACGAPFSPFWRACGAPFPSFFFNRWARLRRATYLSPFSFPLARLRRAISLSLFSFPSAPKSHLPALPASGVVNCRKKRARADPIPGELGRRGYGQGQNPGARQQFFIGGPHRPQHGPCFPACFLWGVPPAARPDQVAEQG